MILFISILLGLIIGLCLKGKLIHLGNLRGLWFPIISLAVSPILNIFTSIPIVPKAILISLSYIFILLFLISNRKYILSVSALGLGSLCNFVVIALNGFRMPVSPTALSIYPGMTVQAVLEQKADYFIATKGANLMFLGDVIYAPIPVVGGFMSVGDILIDIGMLLLIVFTMIDKSQDCETAKK